MKIKKTQLRILVRQALLENKSLDPALKYDTPLYKRLRKDPNFQSSSIKIKKAISGLVLLKEELMSELGIDKSLYNTLCLVALGIFGRETKLFIRKIF